ncbi:MAG TPA: ATP-binding cassette domain-containing protein [Kofleriaceae bacterium]|nr:ATP-binding cassette domain-containing protein [Kofleriaceae bacterium]
MLELRKVKKVFPGGAVAVDGVSFEVPTGTITCLLGTSGCGKTTTLKMINRLLEPTAGDILLDGRSVRDGDPVTLRRGIGYVVQKGGLMPHMTARRNVALLEEVKGTAARARASRADELLALVGLAPAEYGDRYPSEMSGGQQQRVGIARALMSDPPVLLMDEPFSALDPITRSRIHEELLRINARLKKTIVIVTHDLAEAFKLGDDIVLMRAGRIVQRGRREDFLERPADDFAAEFIRSQTEGIVAARAAS